jgi:hypothetical protein
VTEPDLLTLRRAAVLAAGDPRAVYRWRVAAAFAGLDLLPRPGDEVTLADGRRGRVLHVLEEAAGSFVSMLVEGGGTFDPSWRVTGPHRPALLLGEEELRRRLHDDEGPLRGSGADERACETLHELARRAPREAVDVALDALPLLDRDPQGPLRGALAALLRCRPPGEVEVALLRRPRDDAWEALELTALAGSAPDEATALDTLERLLASPRAVDLARRAGRWLVGAGGPGFVAAAVRERVGAAAREHPSLEVRRALFVHAAAPLQPDALVEAALASADATVRAAAAAELLRRGAPGPVWARAADEEDPAPLLAALERSEATPPLPVLRAALERAREGDAADPGRHALEREALRRVPELDDAAAALDLLRPWLDGELDPVLARGVADALWAAGLVGAPEAADAVLERARELERLAPVALEALVRLGGPLAETALDAWGADLLRAGAWGEEVALLAGLLLGRPVDLQDLAARFVLDPPRGPVRAARAHDVAAALARAGDREGQARLLRAAGTLRLRRYAPQQATSTV